MNILYINHYAGGPKLGMEFRPFYLAREWVKMGHRVVIVAASYSHVRGVQPIVERNFARESVEGVEYIWCRTNSYSGNGPRRVLNILLFLFNLLRWRRWLDFIPDLVIASSTYPADIGPARRLARRFDSVLAWEVHDLWPLSPIELGGMSRRHPFILWMQHAENYACRHANYVVSLLPCALDHLQAHGLAAERYVHIPNGIEPEEWYRETMGALPHEHQASIDAARRDGGFIVCYAGAHGLANALDIVIAAAGKISDKRVTWLLVGEGPEKRRLQDMVAQSGLGCVKFLPSVPRDVIPLLLRQCDALYIGLKREPLFRFGVSPNKLMDYMMAARPIICAIDAGNDPVSEQRCGYSVAAEDPAALAEAVESLLRVPLEERNRMGQRGRSFVESNHTYSVLAKRFLNSSPVKNSGLVK